MSLFMILSLAACGSNQAEKKPSDSENSKTEISQSTDDQKNEVDQDAEAVTQEEADENMVCHWLFHRNRQRYRKSSA